jgi:predicted acylesterase/phospholipase RssA
MDNKLTNPLDKIALSLSGGGYRAASFHLGTMAYLNRLTYKDKPLLANLRLISTVSGGTITGVMYVLMMKQGLSFREFYQLLLRNLGTLDLVKTGIEQLNPDADWKNTEKTKNLINAFAEQYKDYFTGEAVMADLEPLPHRLEQVIFNSTEFSNAINFRFKTIKWPDTYAGNFYHRVLASQLHEVRLSDIIAASSCFPGGFEPMLWPNDFLHRNSPMLRSLKQENLAAQLPPLGVMDGGIYDNQGIDSILTYKKDPYFDLVIISDVASPDMQPYKPFVPGPKTGFKAYTIKDLKMMGSRYNRIADIGLCVSLLLFSILPLFWGYRDNIFTGVTLTITAVTLVLIYFKAWALGQLNLAKTWVSAKLLALIPKFYQQKLSALDIDQLSLHRLEPLITDRLNSLVTLLMEVFLKVVRRLNYNVLYQDEQYAYKRIDNRIKELTEEDFLKRHADKDYAEEVSPKMKAVAEEAAQCGTSLWFTDTQVLDETLKKLVASGEFTMCFNMKIYLEKIIHDTNSGYQQLDPENQGLIDQVYQQCVDDLDRFRSDPYFLYNLE